MIVSGPSRCRACGDKLVSWTRPDGVTRLECFYPDCPTQLKGRPDESGVGCGVWPVLLKDTRFYPACEFHDRATMDNSWHESNLKRRDVDRLLLEHMLAIAGDSAWHRFRARIFYGVARAYALLTKEG